MMKNKYLVSLPGVQNPNYNGSIEHVNQTRPADYNGMTTPGTSSHNNQPYTINLG